MPPNVLHLHQSAMSVVVHLRRGGRVVMQRLAKPWALRRSAGSNPAPSAELQVVIVKAQHQAEAWGAHPESRCHRCDGPNTVWFAPSPLWNAVMRGGSINGTDAFDAIVCPTCFATLAEDAGIADGWLLSADSVYVELETTTPSGRVWNEQTNQWEGRP